MPGLFVGLYLVMLADQKRPKRCARKLGKLGVQFSHLFRKSAKWMGTRDRRGANMRNAGCSTPCASLWLHGMTQHG